MPGCGNKSIFLPFWLHNCFLFFRIPALPEKPSVLESWNSRVWCRSKDSLKSMEAFYLCKPSNVVYNSRWIFFNLMHISVFVMSLWQLGRPNVLISLKVCRIPKITNSMKKTPDTLNASTFTEFSFIVTPEYNTHHIFQTQTCCRIWRQINI